MHAHRVFDQEKKSYFVKKSDETEVEIKLHFLLPVDLSNVESKRDL